MNTRNVIGAISIAIALSACHDDYDDRYIVRPYDVPNSVVIADFNGDGKQDLAVAATHMDGSYPNPGFVSIILQGAAGTFAQGIDTAVGFNPSTLASGNLNGAGGEDLVVANASSSNISVLLQSTAGGGQLLAPTNIALSGTPYDVAIGNLNGDTALDLAVANTTNNALVLFQNPASPGQYLAPTTLAVGNPTTAIAIGDVNADGRPDVIVASEESATGIGRVSVFLRDPVNAGQFLARTDFPAGSEPLAVKIADVNGDGLPDLIVANHGPGNGSGASGVSVLLQSATTAGSFLPPVTYATARGAVSVAVGDLNGDGKPDLAVANVGGTRYGSVSVLLQDATRPGIFLTPTTYPGVYEPLSIAIGNLNGDTLPDIAVADGNRATIMFNRATAPGTFAAPVLVGD